MRSDAKNLEAVVAAVNYHNLNCGYPATAVAMSRFEKERLGWDDIKGLPIVEDENLGSGVFHVLCDKDSLPESQAVERKDRELVAV